MADASIGEVEITLDGKSYTLRCSLAAAKRINAGGGYFQVASRLDAMDLDYYAMVIAAGLDKKVPDVEERVYRTGLVSLNGPLGIYLTYLLNGGKPAETEKGDQPQGEA